MGFAEIGSSLGRAGSSIGRMGVETGGFGSAVVSVAPAVASIGITSGLGRFGEVMSVPFSNPISEGPVSSSFLENTMPITINDLGLIKGAERFDIGINFPVQESELNSNDAIFEAESILLRASPQSVGTEVPSIFQDISIPVRIQVSDITQDSFPVTLSLPANASVALQAGDSEGYKLYPSPPKADQDDRGVKLDFAPVPQKITTPFLEPVTEINPVISLGVQPQTESKTSPSLQSFARPMPEVKSQEEIIEVTEEEIFAREQGQEKEEERKESSELKLKRIVDTKVAKVRIGEIIQAAIKVDQGKGGEIDGRKIVENLPGQHAKNRSGELNIVDPKGYLFDGSLFATIVKIASRQFSSLLDVYKKASKIVLEDVPVTRGEGEGVTDEDVAKVYREHKGKVPPAIEVVRRVIKMRKIVKSIQSPEQGIVQIGELEKKEEDESNIWDNQDLAQALKAA